MKLSIDRLDRSTLIQIVKLISLKFESLATILILFYTPCMYARDTEHDHLIYNGCSLVEPQRMLRIKLNLFFFVLHFSRFLFIIAILIFFAFSVVFFFFSHGETWFIYACG